MAATKAQALAVTPVAINLDAAAAAGTHSFGVEGVDLDPAGASGTQTIRFDLYNAGATGSTHRLSTNSTYILDTNGQTVASFFAFNTNFSGGARVALADANADGRFEIRVSPGAGTAGEVRTFDGVTQAQIDAFFAFGGFPGGTFIGGARAI